MINNLFLLAAGLDQAVYTRLGAVREFDNAKKNILQMFMIVGICVVAGKVTNSMTRGKNLALVGIIIGGGLALFFINDPEQAVNLVKWLLKAIPEVDV